jgi:copper chaperone CopZ
MAVETQNERLSIDGMHCAGCASKIRSSLLAVDGVTSADVSQQRGEAVVTSESPADDAALRDAVTSAGDYTVTSITPIEREEPHTEPTTGDSGAAQDDKSEESLYPLFLIVAFIAGVTVLIALATGDWSAEPIMRHFMAGFFITFAFFKLLDPPGFVSAYRGYDLIARKVPAWGWVYPFVELALGVAYLLAFAMIVTNVVTLVLMLVGAAGVLKALLDKRAIRCACLGTALNLPMTKVTLVEDLTMAAMAGGMLVLVAAA